MCIRDSDKSILTKSTIEKYFNRSGSISFIAIYQYEIIGYIIGIPIEKLSREPWARKDVNFGKSNTLYTYAFVIKETFFGNGYARILKKVFLSNVAKRKNLNFVTGHVVSGRTAKFKGNISVIRTPFFIGRMIALVRTYITIRIANMVFVTFGM